MWQAFQQDERCMNRSKQRQKEEAMQTACLGFQNLSDVAARQVRDSLKVTAVCLGSTYLCSQGAGKVAEQQVLARHRQSQ